MSNADNVVAFKPDVPEDGYLAGRQRLTELLIQHSLIDSFFNFTSNGKSYPFNTPEEVLPHVATRGGESALHNPVFVILIDGNLPKALDKHFRLRASNRVTWRNIQRMAPGLDLSDFKAADCRFDDPGFRRLLGQLLPLDYALVAERPPQEGTRERGPIELTHMHVKVERLTDNAIKDLGKQLGYLERRLFERGEDYVEALETKFFEYYGFSANASGRKSAAAMSAQLLARHGQRFGVFVSSQEDCRLTVLDEGETVTQYFLIRLQGSRATAFRRRLDAAGASSEDFSVSGIRNGPQVLLFRLVLRRTDAGRPSGKHRPDRDLLAPWLAVDEQAILPLPGREAPAVPYSWAAD